MQTKRKFLSILLTLCMVSVMIPTAAFAAEDYRIDVNNVRITDENADDVLNDGTVSYDAQTNTLSLKGAAISGDFSGSAAIQSSKDNLTIMLEGENTISSQSYGILSTTGTLTFEGAGTLTFTTETDAVRAAEININGAVLEITPETNGCALYASTDYDSNKGSVNIQNGANVTSGSKNFAIYADGNTGISISESVVTAEVEHDGNVICASGVPFSVVSSNVTVKNSAQTTYPAIWASEISISDNSEVTANISGETNAVYTPTTLTVESSSLNAESPFISVWSDGAMKIENGTVKTTCTGDSVFESLHSEGTLTIEGNSDVLAIGGIWGTNGVVVSPAEENKVDVKVGIKEDGEEGTKHLEGSPYDETTTLDSNDVIGGYTYVHIKKHIHEYDQQSTDDRYKISDATCTDSAVYYYSCKCGEEGSETFPYGTVNAFNHPQLVKTEAKEPTYTEEGNIEYWYCESCEKYFNDAEGTQEISYEDTIIPKLQGSTTIYYALHFETNGGEDMNSVVKESGTVMDLSEYVPVREGYTFTGWYADAELTQPVTEVTLDNTKTIYAGWKEIVTDTRLDQEIFMTNPYQERDLANGSRNTMSKVCTLRLGFAVEDPDLILSYETSDPSVATVKDGKITYQGVGPVPSL